MRSIYRYESGEAKPNKLATQLLTWMAEERSRHSPSTFTFIDLFAGIGGMRMPFESIGGKCVFTSEWDEKCRATYAANFSTDHLIGGDIREFSAEPEGIPTHDLLLAGFPASHSRLREFPRRMH